MAREQPQTARQFLHHALYGSANPLRIVPTRAGRVNPLGLDIQLFHLLGKYLHAHVWVALEMLQATETFLFVIGDESDPSPLGRLDQTNTSVMATRADAQDVNSLSALELLPHGRHALLRIRPFGRSQPRQRSGEAC